MKREKGKREGKERGREVGRDEEGRDEWEEGRKGCFMDAHMQTHTYTQISLTTLGVFTQPGSHTTIMSLYGLTPDQVLVAITIDFAAVFGRECVNDDYYNWRPWDSVST